MLITDLLPHVRPMIMGIVNVTPDSFSDGGEYLDVNRAVAHALKLADDGAHIIDIGGESTRPPGVTYGAGSDEITAEDEIARVLPVIERLRAARPKLPISIDTQKPAVAALALAAGASIVNDVSAGRFDERIWDVARASNASYILMHGHDPADRHPLEHMHYDDVVEDVHRFLAGRIALARSTGLVSIIADVGIGFAKGFDENIRLLKELHRFLDLGVPLLVGASRKAFVGRIVGGAPAAERDAGSLAAHVIAVCNGATLVRTHNAALTQQFFTAFEALDGAFHFG